MTALNSGDLVSLVNDAEDRGVGMVVAIHDDAIEVYHLETGLQIGYDRPADQLRLVHTAEEEAAQSRAALQRIRSWKPIDLDAVLSGRWTAPQPTIGARDDGVGLLYPGKVHTAASETEAGKTWFALAIAREELEAGNSVVYIDFEDDEGGVVGRLLTLQIDAATIRDGFLYLRPREALKAGVHLDDLRSVILGEQPTVTIIDGVTEAMTLHGLNPLDNADIANFGRQLPRLVADAGPAVLALDHVTKDREARGRYAIGGVHKLNALDGAAFVLENRTPFGIGRTGRSTIRLAKDRPGQLRRHGVNGPQGLTWFADLVMTSHAENFAELSLAPPADGAASPSWRPTLLMARIADALEQHGELTSQRQVRTVVTGKTQAVAQALDFLILDGFVSPKTPYRLLKPYAPTDEEEPT